MVHFRTLLPGLILGFWVVFQMNGCTAIGFTVGVIADHNNPEPSFDPRKPEVDPGDEVTVILTSGDSIKGVLAQIPRSTISPPAPAPPAEAVYIVSPAVVATPDSLELWKPRLGARIELLYLTGEIAHREGDIVAQGEHYIQLRTPSKTLMLVFGSSVFLPPTTLERVVLPAGTRLMRVRGRPTSGEEKPFEELATATLLPPPVETVYLVPSSVIALPDSLKPWKPKSGVRVTFRSLEGGKTLEEAEIVASADNYVHIKTPTKTLLLVFDSPGSVPASSLERVVLPAGTRLMQVGGGADGGGERSFAQQTDATLAVTDLTGKTMLIPFAEIERVRYYPMPAKWRYALYGLACDALLLISWAMHPYALSGKGQHWDLL